MWTGLMRPMSRVESRHRRKELSMGSSAVGSKQAQEEEEVALDDDAEDNDNTLLVLLPRACRTTAFSVGLFFSGVTTFQEDK